MSNVIKKKNDNAWCGNFTRCCACGIRSADPVFNHAYAQETVQRESLRGIKGIYVWVDDLNSDVEEKGLHKDLIVTDTELRLRKAGISVASTYKEGAPYLRVKLTTINSGHSPGIYAWSVVIGFSQNVMLARNPAIKSFAPTWIVRSIGTVGAVGMRNLKEPVGDGIDKFINDYLAVNPK